MSNLKQTLRAIAIALALAGCLFAGTSWSSPVASMAGGFAGGTFNDFVAGISQALRGNPSIEAVPSPGSVENLNRLRAGELDMAVTFAGDAYLAFNGFDQFDDEEQPRNDIRAIGFLYSAVSQIVTLADSDIATFDNLVGKRIGVGAIGSGTHLSIERLLRQAGILNDVTLVHVSGIAASEDLQAGRIDAYHVLLGTPNATVRHTAATHDIRILDTMAAAIRAGLFDRYPFYSPVVIPSGTYRGVDADIPAFKDAGIWVVRDDLDEQLVYEMTKAVFGPAGVAVMTMVTPLAADMGPSTALRSVAFPLHAGAARYWEEVGLQLPAAAKP
ncbi:MAG: TAXI family TRAP transporter solute-binding subunit [bacterium]|nr:TAXI family TRAP transporter solute-binding subunit [bacterium]